MCGGARTRGAKEVEMGCATCDAAQEVARKQRLAIEPYRPGIQLLGTPEQNAVGRRWLDDLARTPTGRAVLDRVDRLAAAHGGKPETLIYDSTGQWAGIQLNDARGTAQGFDAWGRPVPGPGVDSGNIFIQYNQETTVTPRTPGGVLLGHELIHTIHSMEGANMTPFPDTSNPRDLGTTLEESRTIGIGRYADDPLSENRIRSEWSTPLPRREIHLTAP
jgi:hypothetical protein